jgi:eukaryotic-like serine/threonine-protein kinase
MRCPKCQSENTPEARFCSHCAAPLSLPDSPPALPTETLAIPTVRELAPGATFARRYQVIEELGRGGMGRVYKVFDTEVREKLALKLLNPEVASDEQTIERFRNELKLARTISHRNICRMHDLGREEGAYYITMEYVPGEDLKSFIHRVGALPISKAVSVAIQICEGLAEAHRVGVVHRDLKPQNIMIDREGNARIMDFGIARSVRGKGITGANMMIGTPEYMSPEQVDGREVDRRSDIYSLGIVLFEMLTGRLPFEGDTPLAVAVKQKSEPAPDPRKVSPQIPVDLSHAILRCLEKARDKRYQGADELSADLAKVQESLPKTTQPLPIRRPATSKQITVRLPSKKVWIPAVIGLVMVVAFVVWQLIPGSASARRSIAVMGFKNQTGDPAFDYLQETIPNLLITSLEQSGHFRVTTWQRLQDLLRQAGKGAAAVLDEEAGFEVCRRDGIEALAVGFFTKAGETFVTDVKVLDAATKQPLKTAQARGEGPASILKTQIDEISRSVSRGIGLPALKIEKAQPKVADITTNSIEAYNLYLRGRDEQERFFSADARRTLEKAVALDPEFAAAWLILSDACTELADRKARDEALRKAKQFSAKAGEKDRLRIEARYAWRIENNPEKRFRFLRELTEKYPADKYAHTDLGFYYENRRLYPEALAEYEKAVALDPEFGYALNQLAYALVKLGEPVKALPLLERYAAISPGDPNPKDSLAELYMRMGKLDEATAKYKEVLAAKPDFYLSWASLAFVYALQENYDEANRALEELIARAPTPSSKAEGMWLRAYYRYLLGRWDQALADFSALRDQFRRGGADYPVAMTNWITGFIHTDRREFGPARQDFDAFSAWNSKVNAQNSSFSPVVQNFLSGWLGLRQGQLPAARTAVGTLEGLAARAGEGIQETADFFWHLLLAEVSLAENSVDAAVDAGEKIPPRVLPTTRIADIVNYNQPFLKDVLARAYLKKGDLDKAAAEYRKLITIDPNNQVRYLIHPLYHYRLGRVLEEKGEKARARTEYTKFLEYWKNADPTHPELAGARKRLAALR